MTFHKLFQNGECIKIPLYIFTCQISFKLVILKHPISQFTYITLDVPSKLVPLSETSSSGIPRQLHILSRTLKIDVLWRSPICTGYSVLHMAKNKQYGKADLATSCYFITKFWIVATGSYINVSMIWNNEMHFTCCVYMVGFLKSGHI